jgi:hypothetical protein
MSNNIIAAGFSEQGAKSRAFYVQVTIFGGSLARDADGYAAGVVRNPQKWRDLTKDLAERLPQRLRLGVGRVMRVGKRLFRDSLNRQIGRAISPERTAR